MRTEVFRNKLRQMIRRTPFRPFIISLENGDDVLIEHPENVAFDPRPNAATDFYVISGDLRLDSAFEAISSLARFQNGKRARKRRGDASEPSPPDS